MPESRVATTDKPAPEKAQRAYDESFPCGRHHTNPWLVVPAVSSEIDSIAGTDTAQYKQAIKRLAAMDFDTLCGGHGEPLGGGASGALRILLQRKPNPPTWRELFLRRLPRRLLLRRGMSDEDYEID